MPGLFSCPSKYFSSTMIQSHFCQVYGFFLACTANKGLGSSHMTWIRIRLEFDDLTKCKESCNLTWTLPSSSRDFTWT